MYPKKTDEDDNNIRVGNEKTDDPDVFAALAFGGEFTSSVGFAGVAGARGQEEAENMIAGELPDVLRTLLAQARFADALECRQATVTPPYHHARVGTIPFGLLSPPAGLAVPKITINKITVQRQRQER